MGIGALAHQQPFILIMMDYSQLASATTASDTLISNTHTPPGQGQCWEWAKNWIISIEGDHGQVCGWNCAEQGGISATLNTCIPTTVCVHVKIRVCVCVCKKDLPHSRNSTIFFSLLRGELLHSSYRQMSTSRRDSTLRHWPLHWAGPSWNNFSSFFKRTSPDMVERKRGSSLPLRYLTELSWQYKHWHEKGSQLATSVLRLQTHAELAS